MPLLAHSARPKQNIPPQPYADHVRAVERHAHESAIDATRFWTGDKQLFRDVVRYAARWHDLGKLDSENQKILAGNTRERLPIPHEYAGVRYLREQNHGEAATLVYSHHCGLPNITAEFIEDLLFENASLLKARTRAEKFFDDYLRGYEMECPDSDATQRRAGSWRASLNAWSGLTWRFALSCLVDADHSDTARHYRQEEDVRPAAPRWAERRAALERHVQQLHRNAEGDPFRNEIRQRVYEACRDLEPIERLYACDSGVGTGKTTAVMAHLLRVAEARSLRHIFVVLPYTNIINQSVDVYRKSLVLEGENPDAVVAAHHHQVDFESRDLRQLATLWDCPITVTTAVQFFQTIAAANPSQLRKLHELAGSAIFIDEAHAAIPAWLWPQTWLWLSELAHNWGCHFVLASGSLVRFWEHEDFVKPSAKVPNLLPDTLRTEVNKAEQRRITYAREPKALTFEALNNLLSNQETPRVVIVNTVRTAAEVARQLQSKGDVLHLSTALAPMHRDGIIRRIRERLEDPTDRNWTLVATSCVEAGVDLDFRSAVREAASATSMVQIGGRVNRHGLQSQADSVVWVVSLDGVHATRNPAMKIPAKVLLDLFEAGAINHLNAPDLCTEALIRELNEAPPGDLEGIKKAEKQRDFPEVAKRYRVIEDQTVTVLVPPILGLFESGEKLRSIDILRGSVRIRKTAAKKLGLRPLAANDELFAWTLDYDPLFLGYMKGVLTASSAEAGEFFNV